MPEIYLFVQYLLSMSGQHQTWQALGTPEALVWLDSSSRKVACIERGRSDSDDPLLSGNVIAIYAWQGRSQILGTIQQRNLMKIHMFFAQGRDP